jgi:hypothetical protein
MREKLPPCCNVRQHKTRRSAQRVTSNATEVEGKEEEWLEEVSGDEQRAVSHSVLGRCDGRQKNKEMFRE